MRTVDTAQYKKRTDDFDFDMVIAALAAVALARQRAARLLGLGVSPTSRAAATSLGLKDPVVDALVEQIVAAPDRASLVARTHALDRVLQWGFYVVPNWYIAYDRVAYWDKFGQPAIIADAGRADRHLVDRSREGGGARSARGEGDRPRDRSPTLASERANAVHRSQRVQ